MKVVVLALLAVVFITASVCAQETVCEPTSPHDSVVIDAGVYWPLSNDTREAFGSNWLNVGLEFKVAESTKIVHYAGVGYLKGSGDSNDFVGFGTSSDNDLQVIPITYTQRLRPNPRNGLYAGGGFDLFITRASVDVTEVDVETGDTFITGFDQSDVTLAAHVIGGYAFNDNIRVEARYTFPFDDTTVFDSNGTRVEDNLQGIGLTITAMF